MKNWKDEKLENELDIFNPEFVIVTDSYGVGHYVVVMDGLSVKFCATVVEESDYSEWDWKDLDIEEYQEGDLKHLLGLY